MNEKKAAERKKAAAERQRQLDALRVMNAAQLREATRAQQGTLLAKIKERQDAVHAALVANAKEELKTLRAEARKAAGITEGEDEEEDDEEEGQGETGGGDGGVGEEEDGGRGGEGGNGEMEVGRMVEKEESAIAAAAEAVAASGGTEGREDAEEEEEEEEGGEDKEEKEDSDFAMKEKGTADTAEQGSASGEPSDSDSDDSEVRFPGDHVQMLFVQKPIDRPSRSTGCGLCCCSVNLLDVKSALISLHLQVEDARSPMPFVLSHVDVVRSHNCAICLSVIRQILPPRVSQRTTVPSSHHRSWCCPLSRQNSWKLFRRTRTPR